MHNLIKSLTVGSLLFSAAAFARFDIPIPAPTADISTTYGTTLDSTSTNAVAIKALCGATFFKGVSSSASLTETTDSALALKYSLVFSALDGPKASGNTYGTTAGFLIPMDASWDIKDLRKADTFHIQMKALTGAPSFKFIANSKHYPYSVDSAKAALTALPEVALSQTYQQFDIPASKLAMADWYTGPHSASTKWLADTAAGDTFGIAQYVEALNIQPVLNWASGTSLKSDAASANTLYVKRIWIGGVRKYDPVVGANCSSGSYVTVDDFQSTYTSTTEDSGYVAGTARLKSNPNYFGGYWYAFTDTTTSATKLTTDSAVGNSQAILALSGTGSTAHKWYPDITNNIAVLTASLNKSTSGVTGASSSFTYHRYAGWADIGTDLHGHNDDTLVSLNLVNTVSGNTLQGISFDLYAGSVLNTLVSGAKIDTTKIERIVFKVGKYNVADAQPYQISIPISQAKEGGNICVDASALAQPAWYASKNSAVPFSAENLTKLSWEIIIEDQKTSTVLTSDSNTFAVTNVVFWGLEATDGIKSGAKTSSSSLKATYGSSLVLSYSVPGTSAHIEVVRLNGTKVASFDAASSAKNLSLPVSLTHGSYLVTVKGATSRLVSSLAVAR